MKRVTSKLLILLTKNYHQWMLFWRMHAKERLEDGGTLTIPILNALIKSKGSDPPDGRKKAPFEAAWKQVEHKPNWICTVFFSEQDKKELQVLEDDNLKMKNRFNIHTYQYKLSSDTS